MSLKERVYSILLVSAADSFVSVFADLLPETKYAPVQTAASISSAKRAWAERTFDFVIINSPLPDEAGTQFAIDLSSTRQAVVLLLAREETHAGIHDRVAEYGVFTLPKPTSRSILTQALSWMESAAGQLRQFEKRSTSIEERMAEIRLINKAKWVLISKLQWSEPEAHRYIEKQAMDECISRRRIAEKIIETYA